MRIGIFSDPHLGVYGEETTASGVNARLADYTATLEGIVDDMVLRRLDLVLLGGDSFKHKTPSPTVLRLYQQAMWRLIDANIPVVSITGNHDIGRVGVEMDALQPVVHVPGKYSTLNTATWDHAATPLVHWYAANGEGVWLALLPYPNRQQLLAHPSYHETEPGQVNQALTQVYTRCMLDLIDSIPQKIDALPDPVILLAHCAPDEAATSQDQSFMMERDMVLPVATIPDSVDYAFFGHVHKPQIIRRKDRPCEKDGDFLWVVGSTEQKNFGEEGEDKRWLLLDTISGKIESISTGCRQHRTIDVDLTLPDPKPGNAFRTPIYCEQGDIVRVRVRRRRGQEIPMSEWRTMLMNDGAHSVKFISEYVEEVRAQASDMLADGLTHRGALEHYMKTRNHQYSSDRAARIVEMACSMLPGAIPEEVMA